MPALDLRVLLSVLMDRVLAQFPEEASCSAHSMGQCSSPWGPLMGASGKSEYTENRSKKFKQRLMHFFLEGSIWLSHLRFDYKP